MVLLMARLVVAALVGSSGSCGDGSSGSDGDNSSSDDCCGKGKGDGVCSGNSIVGGEANSGGKGLKVVAVMVVVVVTVTTVAVKWVLLDVLGFVKITQGKQTQQSTDSWRQQWMIFICKQVILDVLGFVKIRLGKQM